MQSGKREDTSAKIMTMYFREIHCWSQNTMHDQVELVFLENGDKI